MIYYTKGPSETKKIGKNLAEKLEKGDIVGFIGELGSGKTTMIKGMVKYLTGKEAVSPSFVIINEYSGKIPVYHFDLYRFDNNKELNSIGWEDYLDKGIILIEWADRAQVLLPEGAMIINLSVEGKNKRKIEILNFDRNKKKSKIKKQYIVNGKR